MSQPNPFNNTIQELPGVGRYFSLKALNDPRVERLPYSIRVLLESAIRNCDEFEVKKSDVENILNWEKTSTDPTEIPFKPARVIMQDFTGVPAVVDLAAMRDAMKRLGGDPTKINPQVPSDLVIDHSVQVDVAGTADAKEQNEKIEFERNIERFGFLKWGAQAFKNMLIVPPGSGIVHQVNLEYLARVVFASESPSTEMPMLYPDSVVGTDSHTTMIDGLGVVGWGVGGIEAEAVMLGQPISMVLPEVVGFRLVGEMHPLCTATDVVLTCTQMLRKRGVVGKFVEFFGPGVKNLKLADRATIANMSPEYGATMGFFPVDAEALRYLKQTGRSEAVLQRVEQYLKAQGMYRTYAADEVEPTFSGAVLELDLSTVQPCVSGPKRPHDRVDVSALKQEFRAGLTAPVSFKGYGLSEASVSRSASFTLSKNGKQYTLNHGSLVLAAITSCTNTSNPSVLLAAGILATRATAKGLKVAPYIKCSLSPGSGVALKYLQAAEVLSGLEAQGFFSAGFGCMTCIGNSGELDEAVSEAITSKDLVVSAVLSGNRNFEGRVHPLTRANYLASPPLVVAYALAGRVDIDFETEALGTDASGAPVFLRDLWPTLAEVAELEAKFVRPDMFTEVYGKIAAGEGNPRWNELSVPKTTNYAWDEKSTYIHNPPFFQSMELTPPRTVPKIENAFALLNVGDSITTDHISPASKIAKNSPAARYLMARGVDVKDFNSYGSRRGNDEIMARGTFANVRLVNKLLGAGRVAPRTVHVPSGEELDIFDAAMKYKEAGIPTIILAGQEYGSGSSRDWAAKGPYLQGVKAVIAQSFERIHRSNLVGMGVLPLQFESGASAETLGLTGQESFTIALPESGAPPSPGSSVQVTAKLGTKTVKEFSAAVRLDTAVEVEYFRHGGILHYVLRRLATE